MAGPRRLLPILVLASAGFAGCGSTARPGPPQAAADPHGGLVSCRHNACVQRGHAVARPATAAACGTDNYWVSVTDYPTPDGVSKYRCESQLGNY
jgi:hypothetical protein